MALHWDEYQQLQTEVTKKAFFDITIKGKAVGRIVIGLYGKVAPKTVDSFLALVKGDNGLSALGNPMQYKGNKIHRIIPNFMFQTGDFDKGNGTGGESPLYGRKWEDETQELEFDRFY